MRAQIVTPWLTDGVNRPQLADDHPCSWQDVTGQQSYQLPTLPNAYVIEVLGVDQAWLNTVAADTTYVTLWSAADEDEPSGTLTEQQLTAIRSHFAAASEAQLDRYIGTTPENRSVVEVAERVIEWSSLFLRQDEMDSADYAALVNRYPQWQADTAYIAGDLFAYNDNLYECAQSHTSQAGWEPPNVPALWTHAVPQSVIPIWVQPSGSHDAYALGAQVTHNGSVWESTVDNNVWEPSVFGWVQV